MRTLLRSLLIAILLLTAEGILRPWVDDVAYAIRLGSLPAPAALPVPVAGVKPAQLADTWGGARSGGRRHEGIDIFAQRGTPVLSSTEGIVLRVGTNRLGGQVVWVLGPPAASATTMRTWTATATCARACACGWAASSAMLAIPATPRPRRRTCITASIRRAEPSIPIRC